jgi:hypothetical protein
MKNIVVDYREGTIILSSAFERKAFTPGTAEYAQLMEVRHEFPDFRLSTRQFKTNTKQDRYKGLTYDYMRWYIGNVEGDNAPAVLSGLEDLIDISRGHSTCKRYPVVKKWFLNRYPEFATFGMTEEQIKNRHLFQKITMPCTIALIFLYILLMPKIGFTIATFFFLTLQITLLSTDLSSKSWLKSLLIALIAALVIYIIFGCAFGLAVPKVSFVDLGLGNLYRSIFG